jgi:hypothetical protein
LLNFKQGITIPEVQYSDNQFEVNPSGVVFVVGCHFPGMLPGLLEDDTSGVRNPNAIPVFLQPRYSQVTIMAIRQPALRVVLPVTRVMPDDDNANKTTSPEGWPSNSPGFVRGKRQSTPEGWPSIIPASIR